MISQRGNQDLIWKIGNNEYTEGSVRFLKRFETSLCLFSNTVAQLYSNYEMVAVTGSDRIVALPNPHAYHDTFSNIDHNAIVPTGIRIIPSEYLGKGNEHELTMIFRSQKTSKVITMPLADGIKQLEKKFGEGNFLPVMVNKDLHLLNGKIPAMHLHRVKLDKLNRLSLFQRSDLQLTIETKMAELAA